MKSLAPWCLFLPFPVLFWGRGESGALLWALTSCALMLSAAIALLDAGVFARLASRWLRWSPFFLWNAASLLMNPSSPGIDGFSKAAGALSIGILAAALWKKSHRAVFYGMVAACAAVQALFFAYAYCLKKPLLLILPNNPQYGALWLAAGALLALSLFQSAPARRARAAWGCLFALLSAAAIFFPSRSGLTALAGGASYFLFKRGFRKAFLLPAALCAFLIGVFPGRFLKLQDPAAWKRTDIWAAAVAGVLQKPVFGWGWGNFEALYMNHALPQDSAPVRFGVSTQFAHNDYLQTASYGGLPALFLLLFAMGSHWRSWEPVSVPEIAEKSCLLAAAVFCLFNFPFFHPAAALLIGLLLARSADPARQAFLSFKYARWLAVALLAFFGAYQAAAAAGRVSARLGKTGLSRALNPLRVEPLLEEAGVLAHPGASSAPNPAQAARLLKEALNFSPDNAEAWRDLAHLYSDHRNPPDWASASAAMKRALFLLPKRAVWWLEYSLILDGAGDGQAALACAHEALRLEPSFAAAVLQVGVLRRKAGSPKAAKRWLEGSLSRLDKRKAAAEGLSAYARYILFVDRDAFQDQISLCESDKMNTL